MLRVLSLAAAIHGGIAAAGGHSADLGVVATPAVARWCDDKDVAGAVVSASHNPWHDNGVKFFAAGGTKLSEDSQEQIQQRFDHYANEGGTAVAGAGVDRHREAVERHLTAVVDSLDGRTLGGLRVGSGPSQRCGNISG